MIATAVVALRMSRSGTLAPDLVQFTIAPPEKTSLAGPAVEALARSRTTCDLARWSQHRVRGRRPSPRSNSGCDRWPARRRGRYREPRAAAFPFWSPDSQFVAFFAGGKLKKVCDRRRTSHGAG